MQSCADDESIHYTVPTIPHLISAQQQPASNTRVAESVVVEVEERVEVDGRELEKDGEGSAVTLRGALGGKDEE